MFIELTVLVDSNCSEHGYDKIPMLFNTQYIRKVEDVRDKRVIYVQSSAIGFGQNVLVEESYDYIKSLLIPQKDSKTLCKTPLNE